MLSRRFLRIKVIKALYSHFKSESDSLIVSEKNLQASITKTYDLYHQMLWLPVEIKRYADSRIELGRKKKLPTPEDLNPNTRFIDNRVITQLEESDTLTSYLERKSLGWVNHPELIKALYTELTGSDFYKKYMKNRSGNYKEDLAFTVKIFTDLINDNEILEQVLEEQSIFWSDDVDFVLLMIVRTLEEFKAGKEDIPVLPMYKSQDDKEFASELFRKTLVNYNDYIKIIDKYTSNWELDRIAFTDNIIMATAIAELVSFPSIPVKVTLDEYIEIAKYYSTPGSSVFINGVLDKVIEHLTLENVIVKTGRGLI